MKFLTRKIVGRFLAAGSLLTGLLMSVQVAATPYSALYVFGDSLSDNGNAYAASGNGVPVSPDYFQGRFTNGPVAAELLAAQLGINQYNFAYGGARTGYDNVLVGLPGLRTQVDGFTAVTPAVDPNALFLVWAGPNDFVFGFGDPAAAVANAVNNISSAIASLAMNSGARRFLAPNMVNLGVTPLARSQGPEFAFAASLLSQAFNSALNDALDQLEVALAIDILRFDTYGLMDGVVANPAAFGFTNTTEQCFSGTVLTPGVACADANPYLFWDDVHPTARGHQMLAAALAQVLQVPAPAPVALMLIGLLAVPVMRRRG